ncbi:MAG: metallophosphoesterase [Lentisphaeria bacterium]
MIRAEPAKPASFRLQATAVGCNRPQSKKGARHARALFATALGGLLAAQPLPAAGPVPAQPEVTFGVVADVQYADADPAGSRHYRAALPKLAASVQAFNAAKPDFVIQLGDLVDHGPANFGPPLAAYAKLAMPRYQVIGNHDAAVAAGAGADVAATFGLKRGYYDFAVNGWRFIVLNGNAVSLAAPAGSPERRQAQAMLDRLQEAGAPNAMPWNGACGEPQLAWLRTTLANAAKAREAVVVFCHFPVYPPNVHNLWDDGEVVGILEAGGGVAAFFSGHNHGGNYGEKRGIHYVTLHGLVETPDTTAYARVALYPDRLVVTGHGREPSRTLPRPAP